MTILLINMHFLLFCIVFFSINRRAVTSSFYLEIQSIAIFVKKNVFFYVKKTVNLNIHKNKIK